jgi:hypothetical protein
MKYLCDIEALWGFVNEWMLGMRFGISVKWEELGLRLGLCLSRKLGIWVGLMNC